MGFWRFARARGSIERPSLERGKKAATLKQLIALLRIDRIETEDELRGWLESPQNMERLQTINGIKDKTARRHPRHRRSYMTHPPE